MIPVAYPEPRFKIKEEGGQHYIFDDIRKTWLRLTEEEWVRQNFVRYLVETMRYPATVIALEKEILLNDLKKRFDVLVYDKNHQPWILAECKAPNVALNDAVLQQVLRYHISLPTTYLVITNGKHTFGWRKREGTVQLIREFPAWDASQ